MRAYTIALLLTLGLAAGIGGLNTIPHSTVDTADTHVADRTAIPPGAFATSPRERVLMFCCPTPRL